MSKSSESDAILALLKELDEDVHRITAKAGAVGELRTTITGTKLRARIGRLQVRVSRERERHKMEGDNVRPTKIHFPYYASAVELEIMNKAVTIDPPAWRGRKLR